MDGANAYAPEFMTDYNRRFAREPQSAHDAHRPLLPHEKLDRVFTWQEERRVTQNLTLHYKRIMYLLEPSDRARTAAGKQVLVRETNDGEVAIEYKGVALPARKFVKDARVSQSAYGRLQERGRPTPRLRTPQWEPQRLSSRSAL
jgi:hypothetical protein